MSTVSKAWWEGDDEAALVAVAVEEKTEAPKPAEVKRKKKEKLKGQSTVHSILDEINDVEVQAAVEKALISTSAPALYTARVAPSTATAGTVLQAGGSGGSGITIAGNTFLTASTSAPNVLVPKPVLDDLQQKLREKSEELKQLNDTYTVLQKAFNERGKIVVAMRAALTKAQGAVLAAQVSRNQAVNHQIADDQKAVEASLMELGVALIMAMNAINGGLEG